MSTSSPKEIQRAADNVRALTRALINSPALGGAGDVPALLQSLILALTDGDPALNRRIASATTGNGGFTLATHAAHNHMAHFASKGLLRVMARAGIDLGLPDARGRYPLVRGMENTAFQSREMGPQLEWLMDNAPGVDPLVVDAHPPRSVWSVAIKDFDRTATPVLLKWLTRSLDALPVPLAQEKLAALLATPIDPAHASQAAQFRQRFLAHAWPLPSSPTPLRRL